MAKASIDPAVVTGKIVEAMIRKGIIPNAERAADAFKVVHESVRASVDSPIITEIRHVIVDGDS